MTFDRFKNILSKITDEYAGVAKTPQVVNKIYDKIEAVLRGLHSREHFLNFYVDYLSSTIFVRDEETLDYISFIPYLDRKLLEDGDRIYVVYVQEGEFMYCVCGIRFIDICNYEGYSEKFGISIDVMETIPLGMYYPSENRFERFEET